MQFTNTLLALGLMASSVIAHPGPHAPIAGSEVMRRNQMSKRCASAAASLNQKRYNKRNLAKRAELEARANSSVVITTEAPYYEVIQNDTCVLTPETTEGPYVWPRSQTLRQDMSEGEPGVPLQLDVGVLDMATCEPLENALVDFWHCNATGSYSSFTGLSPNTPFLELLSQLNINESDFEIGVTDLHTDDTTFLRGMWPTDANGMLEMKTIFPGFYVGRAIHIHVQVLMDWKLHSNGTLSAGTAVNTGQIYMGEELSTQIMALDPYATHTQINRTTNAEDSIFDTTGGYNPVIDVIAADGVDMANGMIGYITIGVDTSAAA